MEEHNRRTEQGAEKNRQEIAGGGGVDGTDLRVHSSDSGGQPPRKEPLPTSVKVVIATAIGLILAYLLVFYPLPYYIYQPGSAEVIQPMVKVAKENPPDKGAFMLTTVGVLNANAITYSWARLTDQEMLPKTRVLQQGETEEEYNQRQVFSMVSSQSNAILAAYRKLDIPFHYKTESIMVMHLVPSMPAASVLRVGDILLTVDGKTLETAEQLVEYVGSKKAGDAVKVSFKRGETVLEKEVKLDYLPADPVASGEKEAPRRVGMGISYNFLMSVQPDNPDHRIDIQAGEIGGPSAGLMFTLEIMNRLLPEDLTKGHRIAGTGTIEEKGTVGPIGGIPYKVIAANRQKAEYFFAPKENAADAIKQAEKLKTKMKIITVETLDDAVKFLKQLPDVQEGAK